MKTSFLCTMLVSMVWGCLGLGCSVDEFGNPQRKDREDCLDAGGTPITDEFCLLAGSDGGGGAGGTAADGGDDRDAGLLPDGGAASDAGDSGMPESCSPEGSLEWCYGGSDPKTALQPPCRAGSRTCHDGVWGLCEKQVLPESETCNGRDDDCDSRTDEQAAMQGDACTVNMASGLCREGVLVCVAGADQCVQVRQPITDSCNGNDDDCDGSTDEDTIAVCYDAADGCTLDGDGTYSCRGRCVAGVRSCVNGVYDPACTGDVTPQNETCTSAGGSALDEDCDGKIDEGCSCSDGASCYTGSPPTTQTHAPCHAGTQSCSDATHGTCMNEVTPGVEDCSNQGSDDDCDGIMDDVPRDGRSCTEMSTGRGACKAGAVWTCEGALQRCRDAIVGMETCDGDKVDEDCDGKVDEGFNLKTNSDNCGACGNRCGAGLVCCNGSCTNITSSNSHCGTCTTVCASTDTCCSSACVNTKDNDTNCGACGTRCAVLTGCSGGSCQLLAP